MAILTQDKSAATARAIPEKCVRYMKRLGLLGFLFFLIKGLLWLLVPALLYYLGAK
jgi:hypothetical protein